MILIRFWCLRRRRAPAANRERLKTIASPIITVDRDQNGISVVHFANGQSATADLYVDCTGPKAVLLSRLDVTFAGKRRLRGASSSHSTQRIGPPCRVVAAGEFGWRAEIPLRGRVARLSVYDPASEAAALADHGAPPSQTAEVTIGGYSEAWSGNCVAIGQAAETVEPLTPAPMMLLQRDIERLASLIPMSTDMAVERREYNRRRAEDYVHAGLFQRALFETEHLPNGPYWRAVREEPMDEKLARKLEQFASRGVLVAYDLEPFTQEDWTILHYGMGRRPARHDRFADRVPQAQVRSYLDNMRGEIATLVKAMPSHDAYLARLTDFLRQRAE